MLLAASTLIISRFCWVLCTLPIWPGIVIPLTTLFPEISPRDPVCLWGWDPPPPPWDLGPILWLCLLIAPANPLPFPVPVASTNSPTVNIDASIVAPSSWPSIPLISLTNFFGTVFAFAKCPVSGFFWRCFLTSCIPNCVPT